MPETYRLARARERLGWTQEYMAREVLRVEPTTVSRWERSKVVPQGRNLVRLSAALKMSVGEVMDLVEADKADREREDALSVVAGAGRLELADSVEDVNRREFVLAAAGVPAFLRGALAGGDAPVSGRMVSIDEVRALERSAAELEQGDAALGGGALCQVAINLHGQVTSWLNEGPSNGEVDAALQQLRGETGAWVGWMAYDAGNHTASHRWLNDAIVHARMTENSALEVRGMSYLCLVLNRLGRHREALQCAQAATRIADRTNATPRVRALIAMREALTHASLRDTSAFRASVGRAYDTYEAVPVNNDPQWVHFVNRAELDGLTGYGLMQLGDYRRAVASVRPITENPDPVYRRNSVYYQALLAEASLGAGEVAEASTAAKAALPTAGTIQSKRIAGMLATVTHGVRPYAAQVPEAQELVDAYELAVLP